MKSGIGLLYLSIFGSVIAYSAYIYMLKESTPARVATYAYVNPVIAVILGWMFANEPISVRTSIAAGVILAAVVLITMAPQPAKRLSSRSPDAR